MKKKIRRPLPLSPRSTKMGYGGKSSVVTDGRQFFLNNWRLLKQQRKSILFSFHGIPDQLGEFSRVFHMSTLQGFKNTNISVEDITRHICLFPQKLWEQSSWVGNTGPLPGDGSFRYGFQKHGHRRSQGYCYWSVVLSLNPPVLLNLRCVWCCT